MPWRWSHPGVFAPACCGDRHPLLVSPRGSCRITSTSRTTEKPAQNRTRPLMPEFFDPSSGGIRFITAIIINDGIRVNTRDIVLLEGLPRLQLTLFHDVPPPIFNLIPSGKIPNPILRVSISSFTNLSIISAGIMIATPNNRPVVVF